MRAKTLFRAGPVELVYEPRPYRTRGIVLWLGDHRIILRRLPSSGWNVPESKRFQ